MEELKKKREAAAAELRRLNTLIKTEGRSFSDEERAQWKQADADYSAAAEQIASEERVAKLEADNRSQKVNLSSLGNGNPGENRVVQVDEEQRVLAMQAWFLRNNRKKQALTDKHIRACEVTGIDPHGEELVLRMADTTAANSIRDAWLSGPREQAQARTRAHMRALSSVTAGTGGVLTMPEAIMQALEINLLKHGGILEVCEVMRTEGRERLRWPTANDTSNKGRRIGEAKAVAEVNPAFNAVYWDAHKYTSDEIFAPYELLTGTPYNLPAVLGNMLTERIARKLSDDMTTGTGVNQPNGLITKATTTSAASATAIAWDDLETLISSVDPSHRTGATFMFHDNTRQALKKLKDGMGRPLWADGPNGGDPANLKGYSWTLNQSMDSSISSGKKTISFGNHAKYKVRMVGEIRLYRLVEKYRDTTDSDAFLAFMEADGNLLDAGTAPVKVLTH